MLSPWRSATLIAALLSLWSIVQGANIHIVFENITPSRELVWHTCNEGYLCARLSLPLDKDAVKLGDVAIALIMMPGAHGSHPSNFTQSPLLVNPGGPGGSGVEFIFRRGQQLRTILGPDHDILAFDPRGIAHSTPLADCFAAPSAKNDELTASSIRRELWRLTNYQIDPTGVDDEASLTTVYHRHSAMSQLCAARDAEMGDSSIFKYAATPYVADDMIGIADAWSRWTAGKSEMAAARIDVNFWGFSYGSLLGAVFAATYPERVGRVIIDGIVDSQKWNDGELIGDYIDADEILGKFSKYCEAAGKRCDMYRSGDSAKDIDSRLHAVLRSLQKSPVAVVDRNTGMPAVITHDYIEGLVFGSLYKPMTVFPEVAKWMAALESGNITRISTEVQLPSLPLANLTQLQNQMVHPLQTEAGEANKAVICGDQLNRTNLDMKRVKELFRESRTFTKYFTGDVLQDVFDCIGWKIRPKRKLPQSLAADAHSSDYIPIKTKNPLIVINTSLDPICPFRGAIAMVPRFQNASLIEVQSEGHCSVSRFSTCAVEALRLYLKDGQTPHTDLVNGKWLRCEADETPWFPYNSSMMMSGMRSQTVLSSGNDHKHGFDIDTLAAAWRGLSDAIQGL